MLPWMLVYNRTFQSDFFTLLKDIGTRLNGDIEVIDFGSGSGELKKELRHIKVHNVDFGRSDIPANVFLTNASSYKEQFDIVFSHAVFHEVAKEPSRGDCDGGISKATSQVILRNLFKVLKAGGILIVYDFVKVDFHIAVGLTPLVMQNQHAIDARSQELLERFVVTFEHLDISARMDYLDRINTSLHMSCGRDMSEFLHWLFIDFENIDKTKVGNKTPLQQCLIGYRAILEHHMRCSVDDYIAAFLRAGFAKKKVVVDNGIAEFIFEKPSL